MDDKNDEEAILRILHEMEKGSDDCPEELIKLAKTPFERTVCIEFYKLYKEFQAFKISASKDMKWLKWLIMGTFTITAFAFIIQLIDNFLGRFLLTLL
jgi:hypothetical protein